MCTVANKCLQASLSVCSDTRMQAQDCIQIVLGTHILALNAAMMSLIQETVCLAQVHIAWWSAACYKLNTIALVFHTRDTLLLGMTATPCIILYQSKIADFDEE